MQQLKEAIGTQWNTLLAEELIFTLKIRKGYVITTVDAIYVEIFAGMIFHESLKKLATQFFTDLIFATHNSAVRVHTMY